MIILPSKWVKERESGDHATEKRVMELVEEVRTTLGNSC